MYWLHYSPLEDYIINFFNWNTFETLKWVFNHAIRKLLVSSWHIETSIITFSMTMVSFSNAQRLPIFLNRYHHIFSFLIFTEAKLYAQGLFMNRHSKDAQVICHCDKFTTFKTTLINNEHFHWQITFSLFYILKDIFTYKYF